MKIQKISSGNASNCQPQRHFSGKISKPQHTKKADVPYMSIYVENYINYPRPFELSPNAYKKDFENLKEEQQVIFFRDNELFDENIDTNLRGYAQYDEDDILPALQFKNPVNINYLQNKDQDFSINECFDTDLIEINPDDDLPMNIPKLSNCDELLQEEKRVALSKARKTLVNGKYVPNQTIENILIDKLYVYPVDTVVSVANCAKIIGANGNEMFNVNLLKDGFSLASRYNVKDVEELMNSCILNHSNGSEYYSQHMMHFLKQVLKKATPEIASLSAEAATKETQNGEVIYDAENANKIIKILSENTPEAAKIKIKNLAGSAPIDNESW